MVGVCGVQTFRKWRDERRAEKQRAQDEEEADRKRKGIMTGREIFMQVGSTAGAALALIPPPCSVLCVLGMFLTYRMAVLDEAATGTCSC